MQPPPQRSRWARRAPWAVPVVVAAVVVGGAQLLSTASAATHPSLPSRTAVQLLAAAQTSTVHNLSGTVTETAALGLPSLPGADSGASLSWQSLITGAHTARVWISGADKQRIALIGTLTEADVVHNGRDLWTYTSQNNEVSHVRLSADRTAEKPATGSAEPHGNAPDRAGTQHYTPMGAAQAILRAVDPSTKVSVDATQVVAGHDAYTLVLTPRDPQTTVRKVTIALDSTHFVPVQVQVFGAGSSPAFQIGFTRNLSFARPAGSTFDFRAPAGAVVTKNPLLGRDHFVGRPAPGRLGHPTTATPAPAAPAQASAPKLLGSGWTSIAYFAHGLPGGAGGGLLSHATSPVGSNGDRLLTTALLNAVITKDGRVFVGAVTPSLLEHAAATTPR